MFLSRCALTCFIETFSSLSISYLSSVFLPPIFTCCPFTFLPLPLYFFHPSLILLKYVVDYLNGRWEHWTAGCHAYLLLLGPIYVYRFGLKYRHFNHMYGLSCVDQFLTFCFFITWTHVDYLISFSFRSLVLHDAFILLFPRLRESLNLNLLPKNCFPSGYNYHWSCRSVFTSSILPSLSFFSSIKSSFTSSSAKMYNAHQLLGALLTNSKKI